MKSNKQRWTELKEKRAAKRTAVKKAVDVRRAVGGVPVRRDALAPNNSYGHPDFVARGYYLDKPFTCAACGREEIWTASQQKWWYEVAKGYVYSTAKLCRACRGRERDRRLEARRVHLAGIAAKHGRRNR